LEGSKAIGVAAVSSENLQSAAVGRRCSHWHCPFAHSLNEEGSKIKVFLSKPTCLMLSFPHATFYKKYLKDI